MLRKLVRGLWCDIWRENSVITAVPLAGKRLSTGPLPDGRAVPPSHFTVRRSGAERNRRDNFVGGGRRTKIDKDRDPPRGPRSRWCLEAHEQTATSVRLSHSESLSSTRHRFVDPYCGA